MNNSGLALIPGITMHSVVSSGQVLHRGALPGNHALHNRRSMCTYSLPISIPPSLLLLVCVSCRAVEQVLTASMHTRTFAVNRPVALAAAAAAGAPAAPAEGLRDAADADGDADMTDDAAATQQQQAQGSRRGSGPLKPLNGPSRQPSPAAAAGGGSGAQRASKQPSQPAYRPEKLVRTDHRTQSIEGFLVSQASAAAMATAAAAAGSAKRRRSAAAAAAGSSQRPRSGSGLAAEQGDEEGFGGDALFSNASLHLQAAAAEEAAAAAELAAAAAAAVPGGELQQLQRQEALLRPVAQPRLPAVQTQLSSIWELLGEVQDSVHGELQQLFKSHTWVGMVREWPLLLVNKLCEERCQL